MTPTLYDVHRPHKQARKPHATMRDRFASGIVLGAVWWTPVSCATWRVWLPINRMRHPSAVN